MAVMTLLPDAQNLAKHRKRLAIAPPLGRGDEPLSPSRPAPAEPRRLVSAYATLLAWAFPLFNTLRLVSYLPTLWAIQTSGDSSQHSLWTWGIWLGANLTMAGWLHEQNGRWLDRAVLLNLCNAAMCGAALLLIVWYRFLA